ncbi:MAG TPA: hypothetical protein VFJ58_29495 [Armatimonadota bacterium]|nr:hypothetical protein [Armatimonadota bacterium]
MEQACHVGSCYTTDRREWVEGAEYSYRTDGHQLLLFLNRPTSTEVSDVVRGKAEIALRVYRSVIFLLYRFGRQPWNSAPFSWHLVPHRERQTPPAATDPAQSEILHVLLVDALTGSVRGMRELRLSGEFTQTLHDAIRKQSTRRYAGNHDFERSVKEIDDIAPDVDSLLAETLGRCVVPAIIDEKAPTVVN